MLLSGQALGNAAGDLNQEQILPLPSKGQIKQKGITMWLRVEGSPKQGWLWFQIPVAQDCVHLGFEIFQEERVHNNLAKMCYYCLVWSSFFW